MESLLSEYYKSINVADSLDKSFLNRIGEDVVNRYDEDESERQEWLEQNEKAIELAGQDSKGAKWAGEESFDVMYPLVSTAAIQFAARAYPNIIKGADVVKCAKPGIEQTEAGDEIDNRGMRVAKYMNYQLLNKIQSWPDEMDQLLFVLPVMGCHFKKTYKDEISSVSENVPAKDLVIPFKAKSLEAANRITQIIPLNQNEVVSKQRMEMYREMPIVDLGYGEDEKDEQTFLEQHCWIDIDGDGYKEPYVVVVHKETGFVMRITARWNKEGVKVTPKDEIYNIEPVNYYTRYLFMPAFNGSIYGMGFGQLLGPINKTVNSVLNQLLDSGSLYTRQGGFIGKDISLGRNESMYFKVGEWKHVQFRGDDLRKNLVPLPTHEPSTVLFQLLGMMVEAGKEMSSTSELLSGEQRQSNVPASTTLALIEQGLKVFSGIYKRIYRSLKGELSKIRGLNYLYLPDEEYQKVLNVPASAKADFFVDDEDIVPVVDETELTEMQRLAKAEALQSLKGQGYNDMEIDRRYLEALDTPNIDQIIPQEKAPDPKEEAEVQLALAKTENESAQAKLNTEKVNTEIIEQHATQAGVALDARKMRVEEAKAAKEITAPDDTEKPKTSKKPTSITPTVKKRDQKQPFREVGMKSDNRRRKENK